MEKIRTDYTTANLNKADRAMLDFCKKLTLTPARMMKEDSEALRKVGFDDRGIFQISSITAWFNYHNRMADALGLAK